MEQFHRNNPGDMPDSQSSRSSFYSTDSAGNRVSYMENRASSDTTRTTSSRPISIAPSYMSGAVPRRKPAPIMTQPPSATHTPRSPSTTTTATDMSPSATATATTAKATAKTNRTSRLGAPRASKGLLLVVVAAEPSANTISHIRVLFKRHAFSGITILGRHEHEARLKQLRIDMYSLIGRMKMELGVQTYLRGSWSEEEMSGLMNDAVGKVGERVRAVLCVPGTEALVPGDSDILLLNEGQVATTWLQSFGFIHTVARTTFPLLMLDGHPKRITSGFFVTQTIDQGAATMVMRSACGLLLRQLADTYKSEGLAVGYAEENLIPEPEPEPEPEVQSDEEVGNPHDTPRTSQFPQHEDAQPAFTPGESPTKLWGMWALQEHLGD